MTREKAEEFMVLAFKAVEGAARNRPVIRMGLALAEQAIIAGIHKGDLDIILKPLPTLEPSKN